MYDDVLNGIGVGSACGGKTRDDRLLAGFTATPRRYTIKIRLELYRRKTEKLDRVPLLMEAAGEILHETLEISCSRTFTRVSRAYCGGFFALVRADGLSLRPFFDHSIGGLDLYWGIANGYLVDIHAYAVITATDIASVPVRQEVRTGQEAQTPYISRTPKNIFSTANSSIVTHSYLHKYFVKPRNFPGFFERRPVDRGKQ